MNLKDYLKIGIRNAYIIILLIFISIITTYFAFFQQNIDKFQSTIFVTFANQQDNEKTNLESNILDSITANDQFAESVQGWFRNPSFLDSLYSKHTNLLNISAKKQEKQNIIIIYETLDENSAKEVKKSINELLNRQIVSFNNKSQLNFDIAIFDHHYNIINSRQYFYLLAAVIFGLLAGYLVAISYEFWFDKLKSPSEIKAIFCKEPFDHFKNEKDFKLNFNFLINKLKSEKRGYELEIFNLTKSSKFGLETISKEGDFKKTISLNIPNDLDKINPSRPSLIILQYGVSELNILKKLSKLNLSYLQIITIDRVRK
ncbi:hypothetical protein GF376_04520 [Candidatus Peregrinibacteria bacterium]|nr:hypothetical protein [Candidatus Peregrinibacteria bacterium]